MNLRDQFPQLKRRVNGQPLTYLDSAATTLKPQVVIDRLTAYYSDQVANVHRGAHAIANEGTHFYESTRKKVAEFIGAATESEVIFTRGTTESINLVASTMAVKHLKEGDEILITEMEHHSNIVPWHLVAEKTGAVIKAVPITEDGDLDFTAYEALLSHQTKVVAVSHMSNVLGVINDVKKVSDLAHEKGAIVVVDGAQAVSAQPVNVNALGCDFYAFSAHKLFAPFGVGVLWGKEMLLNSLPPYQGGGSMISEVTIKQSEYLPAPQRFEAGTPNVGGVVGFGAALDFVMAQDFAEIQEHEATIYKQAKDSLSDLGGIRIFGSTENQVNALSFEVEGAHHSDVSHLLDQQGIAVRAGHHCAQPLMKSLGVTGTLRASFSLYSDESDIERLVQGLKKAKEMLL